MDDGTRVMREPGAAKQCLSEVSEDVVDGEGGTSVAQRPTSPSSLTVFRNTVEPCLPSCTATSCPVSGNELQSRRIHSFIELYFIS